ncbi:hypothetical protein JXA56_04690 [Candidatus Micrarchaeota archaeon]|nr:hypothetical protein [Candidatus Micrarchaeota archaeon]
MQIERTINIIAMAMLALLVIAVLSGFLPGPKPRPYSETPPDILSAPGVQQENPAEEYVWKDPETGIIEKNIHALVNLQRSGNGLSELAWNDEISSVAREHSRKLAEENALLTEQDMLCYYPMIHHEGFVSGETHAERLKNQSINYFLLSGENIILVSTWYRRTTYDADEADCMKLDRYIENVSAELEKRLVLANQTQRVKWNFSYLSQAELEKSIVTGWMESPLHRENILNEKYTEAGVGAARINDFYIVTEVFIERIGCGYLNGPCCVEDDHMFCYEPGQCFGNICLIP